MLRIGNCSGFYGDRLAAMHEMLDGGDLDVLTGDYLAELTMLILARDRDLNPRFGYAKSFVVQLRDCLRLALDRQVKIVVNAGGVNPRGLVDAVRAVAADQGLSPRVALVRGDDLGDGYAYLGAFGIARAMAADIVITGRVTDASLVIGPAIAHYGWSRTDFDRLAGATVAGHVLECGTQATGGNYAFFQEIPDLLHPGFPLAEIAPDGSSVITKHPGTGGAVTIGTVTSQLVYEIGGPRYAGPDVTTRLDTITLHEDGPDRVAISGVRGEPPPPTLKVAKTHAGGYRNELTVVLTGLDIEAKAELFRHQFEAATPPRPTEATPRPADATFPQADATTSPADATTRQADATTSPADATTRQADATTSPADATTRQADATSQRAGLTPGPAEVTWTLARLDSPDAPTQQQASALLTVVARDPDERVAGRAFVNPAVELALASFPGFFATTPPGKAQPYGVFEAAYIAQLPHEVIHDDGTPEPIPPPPLTQPLPAEPDALYPEISGVRMMTAREAEPSTSHPQGGISDMSGGAGRARTGETRLVPLGAVVGARSGDKGGDANIGLWVRRAEAYPWLVDLMSADTVRELLPEVARLPIRITRLPNILAVNVVIDGLLGDGVAYHARFDPQAKGLGEWLRSRLVHVPVEFLPEGAR